MKNVEFFNLSCLEGIDIMFVVIISKYEDSWILCKHKERNTWEIPGGKCEINESYDESAKRELYEETGAKMYQLERKFIFSYNGTFGLVYYADITVFEDIPNSEMELRSKFDSLSNLEWTYPDIQPYLIDYFLAMDSELFVC